LYQRYSREIWALAYAWGLSAELTQDAFLALWEQWQDGKRIRKPRAWLAAVARNLLKDVIKSANYGTERRPQSLMDAIASLTLSPVESLERKETVWLMRGALQQLEVRDRQILSLRYSLDYECFEIAELLDISRNAVYMRLQRAKYNLAGRLPKRLAWIS
jgi:RNA polymerase sigma-70 factor (ECF subfamily)